MSIPVSGQESASSTPKFPALPPIFLDLIGATDYLITKTTVLRCIRCGGLTAARTRLKSNKKAIYWSCTFCLFPINMILTIWGTIHETTGTHTLIISNLFFPIFRPLTLILYVLVLQTDQSIAYSYSTCFRFLFYIGLKALHLPIINMHYIIRRGGKVFILAFLISFFFHIFE